MDSGISAFKFFDQGHYQHRMDTDLDADYWFTDELTHEIQAMMD